MQRFFVWVFSTLCAISFILFLLMRDYPKPVGAHAAEGSDQIVTLFCAASNRPVIEEVLRAYHEETGRRVNVQYGASQTLLSQIDVSRAADLYLAADDAFIHQGITRGLLSEIMPIAAQSAVVLVQPGNPLGIATFDDLLREDVRLVQANPDAAAIGSAVRRVLSARREWAVLRDATAGQVTSVVEAANQVQVGAADAAIVYDSILGEYPRLQSVRIAELDEVRSFIALGLVKDSRRPRGARQLATYITSPDGGLRHYTEHGFVQIASQRSTTGSDPAVSAAARQ